MGYDVENPFTVRRSGLHLCAAKALPEQLPCWINTCVICRRGGEGSAFRRRPPRRGAGRDRRGWPGSSGEVGPGVEEVMEIVGLRALLESGGAGLVITGEGEINAQSLYGKVP